LVYLANRHRLAFYGRHWLASCTESTKACQCWGVHLSTRVFTRRDCFDPVHGVSHQGERSITIVSHSQDLWTAGSQTANGHEK
jgi:hypothetical protein